MSAVNIAKGEVFKLVAAATSTPGLPGAIKFKIPANMPNRKIYVFEEVEAGNTPVYILTGQVVLYKDASPIATLPASIQVGANLALNESVVSMFTAGGAAVKDSMLVNFKTTPQGGSLSAVLQPREIRVDADEIAFDLLSIVNPTTDAVAWHAFMLVVSTPD